MNRRHLPMLAGALVVGSLIAACAAATPAVVGPRAVAHAPAAVEQADPTFSFPPFPSFEIPSFAIPSFEIPSFAIPSFSIPSFAPDTTLAAAFPTAINGAPVTNVQTGLYIDILHFIGDDEEIATMQQTLGSIGIDLNSMSFGNASVTLDETDLSIDALRVPGAQASAVIDNFPLIAQALGSGDQGDLTITPTSLGGKNISVGTDAEGEISYLYPAGDTLWILSNMTQDEAGTILAALP